MVFSSFAVIITTGAEEIEPVIPADSSEPLPVPLISYNPWVNYTGTTVYHSFTEMEAELQQIAEDHPDITKLISIGKSWQGRDIWAMKVSDNPYVEEADEPEVYFNANHHAREWMTIEITLYLINYLTDFYGTNSTITGMVDSRQIWILPSINPDGRNYDSPGDDPANHQVQAYGWRRNVRDNDNSGTFNPPADGVDLNRNYGYLWGASGASAQTTYDTYGGPYPFSEPETAAVRDFCRQHDFVFAISYHTSSQLILYPWGWTFEDAPDQDVLVSVGAQMRSRITNTALSDQTTYTLQKSSGLYPTAGSDDDWLYGELGVLAYCIEAYPAPADTSSGDPAVTGSFDSFHPASTKVLPVCQDNLPAALLLCQIADNPYVYMDHVSVEPETSDITVKRGASANVVLNVTDDGRRADSFTVSRTSLTGWTLNLVPTSMSLARNETRAATLSITVPAGATPGIYKIWVNATSTSNTSCKDSSLITVNVPYPDDVSPLTLEPFTELGDFPRGNYRIDSLVQNVGEVAVPAFNTQLTVKQLGVGSTVTLFTDNIESALTTQWTTVDHDLANSVSVWTRSTTQKHAGTYSAWCGSGSAYTDDTIQSLMMTNSINLERYNSATLQFWSYYNTELYYDFMMVEGSDDNGKSWDYINRYHGVAQTWTLRTLDLTPFLGAEQFKLRFRFTSDPEATAAGFYLDDIVITANDPTETTIYGPVQMPVGALASGASQELSWTYNFGTAGTFLAEVQTLHATDGNAANNLRSVMFYINGSRRLPEFGGIKAVTNPGQGGSVRIEWDAGLQINGPLTYKVYRFTYAPTSAQVNASSPIWTGTALDYTDSTAAIGTTYYYVVRAVDSLSQAEYNYISKSITPGLTVEHWGSTGFTATETRYMRGVTNEAVVNGLTAYSLGMTQSTTGQQTASFGDGGTVYAGIRAWKRTAGGIETEITSGTAVAIASLAISTSGLYSATWTPTQTPMATTDSIVVKVYANIATPPTTERAVFTTEQLGATQLDANQWTVTYHLTRSTTGAGNDRFSWGTTTYNSNIAGFRWSRVHDPLNDNTLNWTAGGTLVSGYNIYRSDSQSGPWDSAHLIDTVTGDTFAYCDTDRGTADATFWWYVVRAIDGYGTEETNTNAVQEPGGVLVPYAIDLTGKAANSWALVSFPYTASGAPNIMFDDSLNGDGQTAWDVLKWYNPLTPADPWKTYRVGGTANDMPAVNNTMGFWIHLTANGGDQKLTLGLAGSTPGTVNINLRPGWNLVGYPSSTGSLGSSLPSQVDMMSVFSASAAYTDYTGVAIDPVTLSEGHAYFMHATADCVWTVSP